MNARAPAKSLVVCPVGKVGKEFVRKIVERFGHESFDFLLLVYDDCRFDEDGFADCRVVHDGLPLFWRLRKHVTPELCRPYEYVFIWMDDLDVLDFDPQNFLRILRTYRIDVGHPALTSDSVISHAVMERRNTPIGRYTDFAEILGFTFRGDVWERFWRLIEPDRNPWGWGYDEVAYSVCRFPRMAIVDCEVVQHTRKGAYHEAVRADHIETLNRYARFYRSRRKTLCAISNEPWRRYVTIPLWLSLHFAFARSFVLPGVTDLRTLVRTCRNWLSARQQSRRATGSPQPVVAGASCQSSLDTLSENRAPVPAQEEAVPSGLRADCMPATAQVDPTEEPKRRRRTSTTKRVKAKARK